MTKPTKAILDIVWERDQSRCFRCGRMLHRGAGDYSIQHRIPRGMGGSRDPVLNSPSNLVLLCGSATTGCHGWAESYRVDAMAQGFLISHLSWVHPAHVPIVRGGREAVRLLPDGMVEVIGTKEIAPILPVLESTSGNEAHPTEGKTA